MAKVKISLCNTPGGEYRAPVASAGLAASLAVAAQTLTSTGTNQQSTLQGEKGQIWMVAASGGDVHIQFGANPVAGANAGFMVCAGGQQAFAVSENNEKCAVVDA